MQVNEGEVAEVAKLLATVALYNTLDATLTCIHDRTFRYLLCPLQSLLQTWVLLPHMQVVIQGSIFCICWEKVAMKIENHVT